MAALAALMSAAGASGVVAEHSDAGEPVTVLPDAELLSLCREAIGCDRIADAERNGGAAFERPEIRLAMGRLSEACRTKDRIVPRIIELEAVTPAGVAAKAQVIGSLFNGGNGLRARAVRALVADVAAAVGRAGA